MAETQEKALVARWYFGGLGAAGAACCTHPLDLLKVHLQTAQTTGRTSATKLAVKIVRTQGVRALYNGISASIGRQLTYSMTRFAIYETLRTHLTGGDPKAPLPFYQKILTAGIGGACGGFVGTPADMINVRMQNDIKLSAENRRNYKHVFDGAWRVYKDEGFLKLFRGAEVATFRAILMTIGQIAFYDQTKQLLVSNGVLNDNMVGHFTCSTIAGTLATAITQPFDVIKTRLMNAKPGEFRSIGHCIMVTAKLGPMAFYKGFVPAFVRLAPHTILTFMFYEQLRKNFGYIPIVQKKEIVVEKEETIPVVEKKETD
ncbi:mitochondrial dicarboxylate carrier-like [Saccoglossus kowalevskii]|uniref:Mitochondrial dicarboxylate carrier-like n=1 Tax=Saccoglossus kowalevskii TaxID=10224 RepID=A0ABM0GZL6_SACKO|nr:PREDICTED: mitochondrial dicarboxylate carrier-like [Saccoglossus kowalevskii]